MRHSCGPADCQLIDSLDSDRRGGLTSTLDPIVTALGHDE
jgi:hypothetical protein